MVVKKSISFSHNIAFLAFIGSFIWLLKAFFLGRYPDFSIYYEASTLYLSGQNPYIDQGFFSPYIYPPIVLFLFIPFTFLSFSSAQIVWLGVNILCLVTSHWLLIKTYGISLLSKTSMLLAALVFVSFPVKFSLGMGQINVLVLFLIALGLYLIRQKREVLSGLVLGLALVIKLFPILLPIYLMVKLQKQILLGLIVSGIIFASSILVFVPTDVTIVFLQKVIPSFVGSWKLDYYGQSLGALVGRSFGVGEIGTSLKNITTILILGIVSYALIKNKRDDFFTIALAIGVIVTTNLLINTFSWQHHYIWMIIPFYTTYFYLKKKGCEAGYYVLLFFSYILISINFADPTVLPVLLKSHVFFGGMVLLLLNLNLLLKSK